MERFVIVTTPRSGSYHLVSLLNSADDIRCFGEVFKRRYVELPKFHLDALGISKNDPALRDHNASKFIDDLFQIESHPIQGFKAFTEHLEPARLGRPNSRQDWKYVYLSRNAVCSFVSGKRAEKTGIYVMNSGKMPAPELRYKPIKIQIEKLKKWLTWQDALTLRWAEFRSELGAERIHIVDYRDLGDKKRLDDLLAFLGSLAVGENLISDRHKQFDRPFWEGIENATEVKEFLTNSEWKNLLPELG